MSPGLVWNTHNRISMVSAETHIQEWLSLEPAVDIETPYKPTTTTASEPGSKPLLDMPDELALRALLLGIVHRTVGVYAPARAFLMDAHKRQPDLTVSTWIGSVALFELAVLELREAAAQEELHSEASTTADGPNGHSGSDVTVWAAALKLATSHLDAATALSGSEVDLSTRLDSRIAILRDEIALKREMLGL